MEYQRNKPHKPKFFKKSNRPLGFHGYYVEIPEGSDVMRGYRKIKKWIKNDKFFEELKQRKIVLRRLQRERDDNRFMGRKK